MRTPFTARPRLILCTTVYLLTLVAGSVASPAHASGTSPGCALRLSSAELDPADFLDQWWPRLGADPLTPYNVGLVVKDALRALAASDLDVADKAYFWEIIAAALDERATEGFTSRRFEGVDGSIVYQGGRDDVGVALIFAPDGGVYRKDLIPPLDARAVPSPVWDGEYAHARRIRPR